MNRSDVIDPTRVWVFGKIERGWYCAKAVWDAEYARHLESLGYKVERSVNSPAIKEAA